MKVSSHSEWQPLKEVILGSPYSYNIDKDDLSFQLFFHDNIFSKDWRAITTHIEPSSIDYRRYIEEMAEDLAIMQELLENEGIIVRRPITLREFLPFRTPYWKSNCVPALNVRDLTLVVGNEIIETPVQIRSRLFENDLLKPLFYEYFRRGAKWTLAPRPMILDNSLDLSYVHAHGATLSEYSTASTEFDCGHEIMFDAAQCLRFGKDILFNIGTENHRLGFDWLRQHLGDKYRVHAINVADNHIDSTIFPLRPGLLLVNPNRVPDSSILPPFLRTWDLIRAPEPEESSFSVYSKNTVFLASKYIDVNVFSIDETRILVNDSYTPLIRELERRRFTPIPVRMRHRRVFAGGLHCVTLDIYRKGQCEDYSS
ncbi:MAG: glycine amidinotransferase [Desulfobacteraceae bacterium]|nr:glycine amidinotransferase [Desulfobacteraceae bacterium]